MTTMPSGAPGPQAARKKREDNRKTEVKANKRQIAQAEKQLCDTDAAKPAPGQAKGEKAYIRVAPDDDTLDVANKIRII